MTRSMLAEAIGSRSHRPTTAQRLLAVSGATSSNAAASSSIAMTEQSSPAREKLPLAEARSKTRSPCRNSPSQSFIPPPLYREAAYGLPPRFTCNGEPTVPEPHQTPLEDKTMRRTCLFALTLLLFCVTAASAQHRGAGAGKAGAAGVKTGGASHTGVAVGGASRTGVVVGGTTSGTGAAVGGTSGTGVAVGGASRTGPRSAEPPVLAPSLAEPTVWIPHPAEPPIPSIDSNRIPCPQ